MTKQIRVDVAQVTADGAYDKNPVYEIIAEKLPDAEIIIPPASDAVYSKDNHP